MPSADTALLSLLRDDRSKRAARQTASWTPFTAANKHSRTGPIGFVDKGRTDLVRPSLLGWATHREDLELARGHYVPRARFTMDDVATPDDVAVSVLHSPRPVDWLTSFRCTPSLRDDGYARPVTAQDQLVLEALISAAREQHPSFEHLVAKLSVTTILAILGSAVNLGGLKRSLDRLGSIDFTLPGLRVPNRRMSCRKAVIDEFANNGVGAAPRGFGEYVAQALEDPEARFGSVLPPARRMDTIPTRENRHAWKAEQRRLTPEQKLLQVGSADAERWWDQPDLAPKVFRPVVRYLLVDGYVVFELARYLRHFLNGHRKVDHGPVPYAYVDLKALQAFRSPYSAPIYRYLLAQSLDERRRPITGSKSVEISVHELVSVAGYRIQKGGIRAQLERNVLARVVTDFSRLDPSILSITRGVTEGDKVAFRIDQPVNLRRIGVRLVWGPNGKTLTKTELAEFGPADLEALRVRPRVWFQVRGRYDLTVAQTKALTIAWRLAIDEALNTGMPYYGDLTGNAGGRQLRGGRLLTRLSSRIQSESVPFEFAAEELADPDLTRPEVLDRLELDGTLSYAERDRIERLKAASREEAELPLRVARSTWTERVDDELETRRLRRESDDRFDEFMSAQIRKERREFFARRSAARVKAENSALVHAPAPEPAFVPATRRSNQILIDRRPDGNRRLYTIDQRLVVAIGDERLAAISAQQVAEALIENHFAVDPTLADAEDAYGRMFRGRRVRVELEGEDWTEYEAAVPSDPVVDESDLGPASFD